MKNEKNEREIANSLETLHWEILPLLKEDKRKIIKNLFLNIEKVGNAEIKYWQKRTEAAEDLISVMNVPKNEPDGHNDSFKLFGERNKKWQKSKYK